MNRNRRARRRAGRLAPLAAPLFCCLLPNVCPAAETLLWQLGKPDYSAHEFGAAPNRNTPLPVVVQIGAAGSPEKQLPGYQPGSSNGRTGAKPYPYTLVFNLAGPPRGAFYLDLTLLYRQPRVPSLQVEWNGKRGMYFFNPELGAQLGGENDQFNPIHSVAHRKLEFPASLFRAGENRLTLTAIDDPAIASPGSTVGGEGDSGIFYDTLALSNDPAAAPAGRTEFAFEPTIFFTKAGQEECSLTGRFPVGWQGADVRLRIGEFSASIAAAAVDFGETRYRLPIPDRPGPQSARIEWTGKGQPRADSQTIAFTPARKWKIYYAPHEHLDIGYTDYRPKVAEVFAQNMDTLLDALPSDPSYRFNIDGSWIVEEWLATRTDSQAQRFAKEAREGRIGLNAFFASFVTGYPSFETLTRSLYAAKQLEKSYGVPFEFAQVTDIPSNSWSVPSVLASAGVRYFADGGNQDRGPLLVHLHWNAQSPFWWEGPDGQRVLSFFSYHYHQLKAVFGLPPDIQSGKEGLPRFLETYSRPDYKPDAVLLYGTQVENLPMDYQDRAFVQEWNSQFAYPQIITCRFADYFRYVEERYGAELPVVRGGSGDYWADNEAAFVESTSRDRANQARALSAEKLSALNTAINPNLRFPAQLVRDIWRDILLFAEHTYGSSRGSTQPEHDEVLGQLAEKTNQTIRAQSGIDKLMRMSMSQLANQISTAGESLIVYNPLSWQRSGLVRFQVDTGTALEDLAARAPVDFEVLEDKGAYRTIRFRADDVPPLGYKIYRMSRGTSPPARPRTPIATVMENEFYRVTFDPARGAVKSVFDKQLSRELLDATSPYELNEYLFVTGGTIDAGGRSQQTRLSQPWQYLPPAELAVNHAEDGRLISIGRTPWGWVAKLEAKAEHTPRIQSEIRLVDGSRRIEIDNRIEVDLLTTPTKEAAYFAFPWAADRPAFHFDIANGWVDPERDLMEGACNEWFNVQNWVSVEDRTAAMALAAGSTPLATLGDIVRGRWPSRFTPSSSTVFSYALTNYWSSKWAGRKVGDFDYHYAITSAPTFDPAPLTRFGYEQRNPLEVSEVKDSDKLETQKGPLPADRGSLATVAPASVIVTAVKGAEDGEGLVFRLMEIAGRDARGTLTLPWTTVRSAARATSVETPGAPLEHDAHTISFGLKPHEVLTVRVR